MNNDHGFSKACPSGNSMIDQPQEIKPEEYDNLQEEQDREKYHEKKGG